ncbi:MAG: translation initiation factor IF-3 [Parcubacteria group bacterium CG08_land_8_20_14_0_20_43_9]|nr:MAG: translation initiation factor IF-3 [Parcubacteria group bacterium CG08_land_8_20_14_0_20_43_9]
MPKSIFGKPLLNHQIKAKEIRLIDEDDKQVGVVSLEQALKMSSEHGLDLIQVTDKVSPPICKMGNYGKYLYQLKKKEKKQSRQRGGEVKGVRIKFNTSLHDIETKATQVCKFLKQGNKVKIELRLRGRERALRQYASEQIKKFVEILGAQIPIETEEPPRKLPNILMLIIKGGQKNAAKNAEKKKSEDEKVVSQKVQTD